MKAPARWSYILDGDTRRGHAPAIWRWATVRSGLQSLSIFLASSLLLAPLVAQESTTDATDDFLWEVSEGCAKVEGTRDYLRKFPQGLHAEEARACLRAWHDEQAAWNRVKGCDDAGEVERFLEEVPESRYRDEALQCLAWSKVRRCDEINAVRRFLREFPESLYAAEASDCIARHELREQERERRALVERRLTECRAHFRAGRVSAGAGGNALACFGQVLGDDPGNLEALQGIEEIVAYYLRRATTALDVGDPVAAEREVGRLESIVPESSDVEALRRRLEGLKQELTEHERIEQERKALIEEVERQLELGEYEKVVELVSDGQKRGLEDKYLDSLARQAEEALANEAMSQSLAATVAEVQAHIEQRNVTGARAGLDAAKDMGLDGERYGVLATAIAEAEREAAEAAAQRAREAQVSESETQRERGDYEAARTALRRARELGLHEARYEEEMLLIARLEAAQLLSACREYKSDWRWEAALDCVRRVLELDEHNAEAWEEARELDMLAAFSTAHQSPSVEGYYRFTQDYPWSIFVDVASVRLQELEDGYWEEVKATDTREGYERYLEIYPEGRYAIESHRRSSGGG